MEILVNSLTDMKALADRLTENLENGQVYLLRGDLGAGKTTLVKMIADNLNIEESAGSPTFALVNIYNGDVTINHLDLYRLEFPEEIESFEYEDYFYPSESVTFIEWPEKAESYLPRDFIEINIVHAQDGARLIEIDGIEL